jgi:hypothetical protein
MMQILAVSNKAGENKKKLVADKRLAKIMKMNFSGKKKCRQK